MLQWLNKILYNKVHLSIYCIEDQVRQNCQVNPPAEFWVSERTSLCSKLLLKESLDAAGSMFSSKIGQYLYVKYYICTLNPLCQQRFQYENLTEDLLC